MAETSVQTGSSPAPLPLLSRVIGVITSPGDTFKAVVTHPKWLGVLVLTTVLGAVFAALPMTTEGGQQAAIDTNVKAMESFGVQVSDQAYAAMQKGAARMPYTTAGSIVLIAPIFAVILSGVLFGIFAISGGGATFKQVFTVYVHAAVISTLGQVFTGTINYFREAMTSATNLSVLLPMLEEGSFIARLAGFVDLFVIWWLSVLSIGLAVAYRRRTKPVAITIFSIYAVIALAIAGIMSMVGGK
jgi:Yip1 domain